MSDFTWSQVHAFRLQRHFLEQPDRPQDLLDVVGGTCGIQAQVMSAAQLALRARSNGVAVSEIERALWQDRILVKVWSMRGTLHLLPARELQLYVAALKPHRLKQEQRWMAQYGIDGNTIASMADAILEALSDGPLTRRQLSQALSPRLHKDAPQIQELIEHGWGGLGSTFACKATSALAQTKVKKPRSCGATNGCLNGMTFPGRRLKVRSYDATFRPTVPPRCKTLPLGLAWQLRMRGRSGEGSKIKYVLLRLKEVLPPSSNATLRHLPTRRRLWMMCACCLTSTSTCSAIAVNRILWTMPTTNASTAPPAGFLR